MSLRAHPTRWSLALPLLASAGGAAWLATQAGWAPLLAWLVCANAAALPLWAWDKRQARRGGFRVPEAALHLWSAAGAAPGALASMALLRHKTTKAGFWLLYVVLALAWITGAALWMGPPA